MFTEKGIEKVLINIDSIKAHELDIISTRLLKVCNEYIIKPLEINFLKGFIFSHRMEESKRFCPENSGKQLLKNYDMIFCGEFGYLNK